MKTSFTGASNPSRLWVAGAAIAALLAVATQAQLPILIRVNIANPAAVTFTATGEEPDIDNSTTTIWQGIVLKDFFKSNPGAVGGILEGPPTLMPNGSSVAYDYWLLSDAPTGINIFRWNDYTHQEFVTSQPAFTGSSFSDFSTLSGLLQSEGFKGDVVVGEYVSGPVIGQYEIFVPEPPAAAWALIAPVGALALIIRRRLTR